MALFNTRNKESVTRTADTIRKYLKRAMEIELIARREIKFDQPYAVKESESLTPMQLAAWLVSKMKSGVYQKATYRQYKAAMVCAFERLKHPESAEAIEFLKANKNISGIKPVVKKTSSRKAKNIPFDDMVKLCEWLNHHHGKLNYLSSLWITCTYHSGLRPCEWENAEIVKLKDEQTGKMISVIKVRNAKSTNGRSHGQHRHIPISHLDEFTQETFKQFMEALFVAKQTESFQVIKERVRKTIQRASRLCFTRRHKGVSMYTMRHQFLANAKATMPPNEAGALAGHAVDDTVTTHYGLARHGVRVEGLKAMPHEILRVKVTGKTTRPVNSEQGRSDV